MGVTQTEAVWSSDTNTQMKVILKRTRGGRENKMQNPLVFGQQQILVRPDTLWQEQSETIWIDHDILGCQVSKKCCVNGNKQKRGMNTATGNFQICKKICGKMCAASAQVFCQQARQDCSISHVVDFVIVFEILFYWHKLVHKIYTFKMHYHKWMIKSCEEWEK